MVLFSFYKWLTEVALEEFAASTVTQSPDSFFFYLADSLASESEVLADFFQSHLLASDAEEIFDDITLSLSKCG